MGYLVKNVSGKYVVRYNVGYDTDEVIGVVPEGSELCFLNDCDEDGLYVFAKEEDGVVFINHEEQSGWLDTKWEGLSDIRSHSGNTVVWECDENLTNEDFTFNVSKIHVGENPSVISPPNLSKQEQVMFKETFGNLVADTKKVGEFNPLTPQEGGDHYKLRPIQPIEYSERNSLSMSQGNIVKYITRHKEKNGVEDLAKVVHYSLLEAYFIYGIDGSTELKQRILKLLGENDG